jgi:hypothetical protein
MYKLNGVVIRKLIVALHFVMKARKIHGYIVKAEMREMAKHINEILSLATIARLGPNGSPFNCITPAAVFSGFHTSTMRH